MAVTTKTNARGATVKTRTKKDGTVIKKVTGKSGGVRKTTKNADGSSSRTRTKDGKTSGRTTNAKGKVTSVTRKGKTQEKDSVAVRVANIAKSGKGANAKKMQDLRAKKKVARKAGDTDKLAALRKQLQATRKTIKSNVKAKRASAAE